MNISSEAKCAAREEIRNHNGREGGCYPDEGIMQRASEILTAQQL